MNNILNPNQALHLLAVRLEHTRWTQADKAVTGLMQDRLLRLNSFASGLTVAMAIGNAPPRISQTCLLLAATEEACDDALYLEQGLLWLLRRYPAELTEVELDLLFKQQWTLAILLTAREQTAHSLLPAVGKYA